MKVLVTALVLSLLWLGGGSAEPREAEAIRTIMKGIWEKPDLPLAVYPVVVAGDYAIADWEQGETGGRALLRKKSHGWEIQLCAGDEIRTSAALQSAGVPSELANRLSASLASAEEVLPRSRLERFSSFKGLVRMDHAPHPHK